MATLAHFSTTNVTSNYTDPIYLNQFEVDFNNKYLTENCHKINKKHCYFNANENGQVIRLIDELIRNKTKQDIQILVNNKEGTVVQVIVFENFQFVEIKDFINFDWRKQKIMEPKVSYIYDKMRSFFDMDTYKQYQRKKKLERLRCL